MRIIKRALGVGLLLAATLFLATNWNTQLSTVPGLLIGVAWSLIVLLAMLLILTSFNSKPERKENTRHQTEP